MNKKIILLTILLHATILAYCAKLNHTVDLTTGAISEITISGDKSKIKWITHSKGKQHRNSDEKYGWGLGYFTLSNRETFEWKEASSIDNNGNVSYNVGNINITVNRKSINGCIIETYTFINKGKEVEILNNIGIHTPFNDNLTTSIETGCNTHIWTADNSTYICAMKKNGKGPHLGLILTNGNIEDYEIWECETDSNKRRIISLCPPNTPLHPKESFSISWTLFSFKDKSEFIRKADELGCIIPTTDKYVLNTGERTYINVTTYNTENNYKNMGTVGSSSANNYARETKKATVSATNQGILKVKLPYGNNKSTFAEFLVIDNIDSIINARANFIIKNQRVSDKKNEQYGAFANYNNETNLLSITNTAISNNCNTNDKGCIGMGIFLAKHLIYNHTDDKNLKEILIDYASFLNKKNHVHEQNAKYLNYQQYNSISECLLIAEYYFLMYEITNDITYAISGYNITHSILIQYNYNLYAYEIPTIRGIKTLEKAGLNKEMDILKSDFIALADNYINNGTNYSKNLKGFEQYMAVSIIQHLSQTYLLTNNKKYKKDIQKHLSVLETFLGFQPSFRFNDIAQFYFNDRHSKNLMSGIAFPHYLSTSVANAFYWYSKCSKDVYYKKRAENIVNNNFCLFKEDGSAFCAYIYPKRINGRKRKSLDSYASGQDLVLSDWYLITKDI